MPVLKPTAGRAHTDERHYSREVDALDDHLQWDSSLYAINPYQHELMKRMKQFAQLLERWMEKRPEKRHNDELFFRVCEKGNVQQRDGARSSILVRKQNAGEAARNYPMPGCAGCGSPCRSDVGRYRITPGASADLAAHPLNTAPSRGTNEAQIRILKEYGADPRPMLSGVDTRVLITVAHRVEKLARVGLARSLGTAFSPIHSSYWKFHLISPAMIQDSDAPSSHDSAPRLFLMFTAFVLLS
ncbi:hypothetical protein FB451DRAFT_1171864 [Mycena latifolia]|nr:hypothetical protein FB451DRAFT_1171864 [Mycena latifolia]